MIHTKRWEKNARPRYSNESMRRFREKNALRQVAVCGNCGMAPLLVTGADVYPHRPDLYTKKIWRCPGCGAYVGCHGSSNIPKGTVAVSTVRQMRTDAHALFDSRWKTQEERNEQYQILAEYMMLPVEECHFGIFQKDDLEKAIEWMRGQHE